MVPVDFNGDMIMRPSTITKGARCSRPPPVSSNLTKNLAVVKLREMKSVLLILRIICAIIAISGMGNRSYGYFYVRKMCKIVYFELFINI